MPSLSLLLPDLATLVPFLLASLALNLTPGADMAYVATRSVSQGAGAGVVSALGVSSGGMIHTAAAAVGLSAVLLHSELAFAAIKYAGAGYLIYLAWRMLRAGGPAEGTAARPPIGLLRVYLEGALTNLLNPKVALFVLAFLPQFVDPAKGAVAWQILFLGLLFNIGGTLVNTAVAVSGSAAGRRLKGSPRFGRVMRRLAALVFVGLAVRLATSGRS